MMTEAEYDAWVDNNIASTQPKVSNQLLEACLFSDLEGIKEGLKEITDKSALEDVARFNSIGCISLFYHGLTRNDFYTQSRFVFYLYNVGY